MKEVAASEFTTTVCKYNVVLQILVRLKALEKNTNDVQWWRLGLAEEEPEVPGLPIDNQEIGYVAAVAFNNLVWLVESTPIHE